MKKTLTYTILTGLSTLTICILIYKQWIYDVSIGDKYGASRSFSSLIFLIIASIVGGIFSIWYIKFQLKYEKYDDKNENEEK